MIKSLCITICTILFGVSLFAEADYQTGLTNALHYFSSSRYWERMHATNIIDSLVSTTTNEGNIAECNLLKAAALIECAEIEINDSAYSEATNLCEAVKAEYYGCHDDWRLWGSILVGMQAMAAMEQYTNAFVAATNAISLSPPSDLEMPTNVWHALFGPDIPSRISLLDAFRINAADALISIDKNADIFAYTNGLSQAGMDEVSELLDR